MPILALIDKSLQRESRSDFLQRTHPIHCNMSKNHDLVLSELFHSGEKHRTHVCQYMPISVLIDKSSSRKSLVTTKFGNPRIGDEEEIEMEIGWSPNRLWPGSIESELDKVSRLSRIWKYDTTYVVGLCWCTSWWLPRMDRVLRRPLYLLIRIFYVISLEIYLGKSLPQRLMVF